MEGFGVAAFVCELSGLLPHSDLGVLRGGSQGHMLALANQPIFKIIDTHILQSASIKVYNHRLDHDLRCPGYMYRRSPDYCLAGLLHAFWSTAALCVIVQGVLLTVRSLCDSCCATCSPEVALAERMFVLGVASSFAVDTAAHSSLMTSLN